MTPPTDPAALRRLCEAAITVNRRLAIAPRDLPTILALLDEVERREGQRAEATVHARCRAEIERLVGALEEAKAMLYDERVDLGIVGQTLDEALREKGPTP